MKIATILPKATDASGETFQVRVRNEIPPGRDHKGGIWTYDGFFFPTVRILKIEEVPER